jgi:hypothetical protein
LDSLHREMRSNRWSGVPWRKWIDFDVPLETAVKLTACVIAFEEGDGAVEDMFSLMSELRGDLGKSRGKFSSWTGKDCTRFLPPPFHGKLDDFEISFEWPGYPTAPGQGS